MIDGVDVSKCVLFENADNEMGCALTCCGGCKGKDCDYKQLQRKEKECEELKKKKEENETFYLRKYANKDSECLELQHKLKIATESLKRIMHTTRIDDTYKNQLAYNALKHIESEEYKQENEKLKEDNKELQYQINCSRGREKGYLRNSAFWETLASKYKQALDEIEGIVRKTKRNMCNNCGWVNTVSCVPNDYVCGKLLQILDIISKAKGGRK